jgi:hypothetical protein
VIVAVGTLTLPGCAAHPAPPDPAAPSSVATAVTPPADATADVAAPSLPACLPPGSGLTLGVSGARLAACLASTCIAYDLPTRRWSPLAPPPSAGALPPGFVGPEEPALWAATLAGRELRACPAPGASDCIVLKLAERWTTPPQVIVSTDRTGAVIWGSPDGKRRAADIYDARSGRLLRALKSFPGNRHVAPFDLEQVGYWGSVLWASWPACEACATHEIWTFDAQGHGPRLLSYNPPAYAPCDDHLELVYPHTDFSPREEGSVVLFDRDTGSRVASYPLGYANLGPDQPTLLPAGKASFVLVYGTRSVRVDPRGDGDHPRLAEFLVLSLDAARAGRPVVALAGMFPRCDAAATTGTSPPL